MSVKAFLGVPQIVGYQNTPADSFLFTIPIRVCISNGGENDGPRAFDETLSVLLPLGSNAVEAYGQAYAALVACCINFGWPVPQKADAFAFVPASFESILPTLPAIT